MGELEARLFSCYFCTNVGHFQLISLKLTPDTSNRCRGCWSKKLISHNLATLEGVGTKKSIARAFLFDQHQSGCWASMHGRFLNANF